MSNFESCQTWEEFIWSQRGPPDIADSVRNLQHPAANLLKHLQVHGAPIPMTTPPWTRQRRLEALDRGPHQSANLYADFVRTEFTDFVRKGFWTILPYSMVENLPDLRLSPLGVVPQRERRPRLIVDLTFYGVNQECLPVAPSDSMQFGRTLQRIIQRILMSDPQHGPVYMSKIDVADGFYRVPLASRDIPKLGVLLPRYPGEEPMIALPLVLPMGWVNSPPYFCAATETGADLMNDKLRRRENPPCHRLENEALANSESNATFRESLPSQHHPRYRRPLAYADIYVDDFIALLQGSQADQKRTMRILLHTLDEIFRPLAPSDPDSRQEPASLKKLLKGDAAWKTRKLVLGWIIDTVQATLELPPHRQERLREVLASIPPGQKRTSVKKWHRLLGELRSMTLAIPGSRGLFSVLQEALKYNKHGRPSRVQLTKAVHQFLRDFATLETDLATRPTRLAELMPRAPSAIGATDASGQGMGGVAFIHHPGGTVPLLWRHQFPTHVVQALITYSNPAGTITNSDLELAGTVAHHGVLTSVCSLAEHTIHTFHDNTPSQFWQRKGSTTTSGPAAYLLRIQSHHQRKHRYVAFHDYLPGPLNLHTMAIGPGATLDNFFRDLRASEKTVRSGVVRGTQQRADSHWRHWTEYCKTLGIEPDLAGISDPVPFLQVFATRYRRRRGPTGQPVRSSTVSDAIRSVGQTLASLGSADPRKDASGNLDFRLSRQFRAYTRQDPPPHRVKPIPVSLVRHVATSSMGGSHKDQAVADMIILAFFFLLRPGEYTGTSNDDTPFRLADIQLMIGDRRIDIAVATPAELAAATSTSLTFTSQKNGVRGEVVNHGLSGHPVLCPVQAVIRRVQHLRAHNAPPHTILASYFQATRRCLVKPNDVTSALRSAAHLLGAQYGYTAADISARSLRAGGAMALFNSQVDSDTIRLIGRWQSDAMLRYLHLQAQPVMQGFARRMLRGGDYAFHPHQDVAPMLVPVH